LKYSVYPAYKDSGVEWLGKVPEEWRLKPLWTLYQRTKQRGHNSEKLLSVYRDYGVIPKASRDDNFNKPSDDLSAYQLVKPGDLAMNKMKAWQGSLAVSEYRGIVSPAYFVFESKHQENSKYLHYLLRSPRYITAYLAYSKGIRVNQWDLDPQNHSRIPVLLPSPPEQTAIANFLDRETEKIDNLIAKQQELIQLLQEKRQAVISHAVTKGLNPDAPMKDSGIEWLGEVPEHWNISQLKFHTTLMQTGPFGSQLHAEDYIDGGIPLINPAHIVKGVLKPNSSCSVDEKTSERLCRHKLAEDDIILARRGELGRCAVVKKHNSGWLCGTGSLKISLKKTLLSEYAFQLISSEGVKVELSLESKGSTMDNLNTELLGKINLPIPPLNEQKEIVHKIFNISKTISGLLLSSQKQMRLLQERRTALISAAVTGKIDVRQAIGKA
jgi:type I restriction enzyme S subunit